MRAKWIAVAAVALAGAGIARAQNPQPAAAQTEPSFPFEGEVVTGRLNVRLQPSSEPDSLILRVLPRGATVRVIGREDSFYRIAAPEGVGLWIWSGNGTVEGDTFVVSANGSPLRVDSRANAQQVGTVDAGTRLKIRRENLGWYQVDAPEGFHCFVSARYIRPVRATAATDVAMPAAGSGSGSGGAENSGNERDRQAEELLTQAQEELDRQLRILDGPDGLFRADFRRAIELGEAAFSAAQSETLRSRAENFVRGARAASATARLTSHIVRLQQQEFERRVPPPPPPKTWLFRGRLDPVGLIIGRPGPYRIVDPETGAVVCWLRFPRDREEELRRMCNPYYKQFVGINGTTEPEMFLGAPVVLLEEIGTPEETRTQRR